jgi:predicted permease
MNATWPRLRRLLARLRALVRPHAADRDLHDELASHLDEAIEDLVREGHTPDEARRIARQRFGGVTQTQDAWRDVRSFAWIEHVARDVRVALRTLRRSPGFSIAAVLILALGMGGVTALFTVVDGVLLKPLDYPGSDRIVAVLSTGRDPHKLLPRVTGGDAIDIAATPELFTSVAFYSGGNIGVQTATSAEFAGVQLVHPDFFRVFDVPPLAGRLFSSDDAGQSAVVGAGFAQRRFGSEAAALHQSIFIENRAYEIVGVMPARMRFPAQTDVWAAGSPLPDNRNRTGYNYHIVGRLSPTVSVGAANDKLRVLAARLAQTFPDSNREKTFAAIPLRDTLVADVRGTLYLLIGAAGLLLLIACANVGNLMLARGIARVHDVAVRAALGASRRRLVAQSLVESVIVAAAACGIGFGIATIGTRAVLGYAARESLLPRLQDIHTDWRVLIFGALLALGTTIACGLAPAMRASRTDAASAMKRRHARGIVGGAAGVRGTLVVVQIALSCLLATDASLLGRSLLSLSDADLGFQRDGVLVMYAHAPARQSASDHSTLDSYLRIGQLFDDLVDRLERIPNVVAAGSVMGLPTGQYGSNGTYAIDGVHPYSAGLHAAFSLAGPGYFQTLGIPLVHGRDFTAGDTYDREPVAIISQALARQSFGDRNPIGQRIMCGLDRSDVWMTIVGVVGDVRQDSPAAAPGPELYMPLRQHPYRGNEIQVVMRTRGAPESLTPTVRDLVRAASPEIATRFTTLDASVGDSIATPRLRATLIGVFAVAAWLLAIAGIYALISYTTAQRTAEFGLRSALGARPSDVARLVLTGAGRLTLAGVAIGLLAAFLTSRLLTTMLFGVTSLDATTYAGVCVATIPVAIGVALIPAWRAARLNPIAALKSTE